MMGLPGSEVFVEKSAMLFILNTAAGIETLKAI